MNRLLSRLHNHDLGILFIRLALGAVFINAGLLKIAAADFVVSSFAMIGIPAWLAYTVMYAELVGGIAMVLGVAVRYAGVVLAVIMLVAAIKAHIMNGFSLANNGYEYVLVLFLGSLAMIVMGAGRYSLARLFRQG